MGQERWVIASVVLSLTFVVPATLCLGLALVPSRLALNLAAACLAAVLWMMVIVLVNWWEFTSLWRSCEPGSRRRSKHMAMNSIRCPVLGTHITRVTDLEGNVTRIVCPEYEKSTMTCRLKVAALEGGPLAQLLERTFEETLDTRGTRCVLQAI